MLPAVVVGIVLRLVCLPPIVALLAGKQVDKIDVSGIKPSKLTNVGLLAATLNGTPDGATKPRHIIDVNLVVQVSEEGGEFKRCIFNPLE